MAVRDQSQFRKMETEFEGLKALDSISPLISLFGKKGKEISEVINKAARQDLPAIEQELGRLRNLPDNFNSIFIERGWVASNTMSAEAMEESM